ncbi:DUF364 domain-containing protein [Actinocorallia sp. B10E7]|uniref:Rossmann-like domain-containing protein n=1 Tax=Actinocorallia sp. B10E7 TaxID=3153558 RepID=UPI00325C555A
MTAPVTVAELTDRVLAGGLGADPARARVSVAFTIRQGARHATRSRAYRNEVVGLRVGRAVGSCAVEPDDPAASAAEECAGETVASLLDHESQALRIAALDAYLMDNHPHTAPSVVIPSGTSLEKSLARARSVVELLPSSVERVLVVGVVNSLLHCLRERGTDYVPCDLKGGTTEYGEAVRTDAFAELGACDAVLASGMTLANGTFEPLLAHARRTGTPLALFAQTGSAVLPWFVGAGVSAVSAEPYPFFWLDGGPSVIYRYREPRCWN